MNQTGKATETKRVLTTVATAALWLAWAAGGWAADATGGYEMMGDVVSNHTHEHREQLGGWI